MNTQAFAKFLCRGALALTLAAAPAAFAEDPAPAAPAVTTTPAAPAAGEKSGKAPSIFSPAPTFDFGKQDSEMDVKHDFPIVNVGTDTLEIKDVKTSCGCTVAEMAKKVLAPGEETVVSATFKLKGKQGKQTKIITVKSNDPQQPDYQLKLEGEAVPAILYEPPFFKFDRIEDDEIHTASITLRANKEDLSFKITKTELQPADQFDAEVKTITDGKEYEISLKNKGPLKPGMISTLVTISTDNPQRPTIQVRASGQVIGALEVMPDQINVTYSGDPEKKTTQYMRIGPGRVKDFQILEASTDAPGVITEIIPRGTNNYNVKVQDIPGNESVEGKFITLKTNIADHPEIKVPFNLVKVGAGKLGNLPGRDRKSVV